MKCAVIVILDGVSYRTFAKLRRHGKVPFIDELSKEGMYIDKCYTVFPSATVSGHASISTAAFPAKHGLVGQAWYDRERREYIGYDFELTMPDNWIDASTNLNDMHLQSKTYFEIAAEHGIKSFSVDLIRKGADLKMSFVTPGVDRGVGFATKLMFLRKFARHKGVKKKSAVKKMLLKIFPLHVLQHEIAVMNTVKAIRAGCRFGVTWFMETDAASHIFGPDSFEGSEGKPFLYDSTEDAIRDADKELEKLYRKLSRLCEPILAIVTDHGQVRLEKGREYHVDLSEEFAKFGINAFMNIDPDEYKRRTGREGEVVFAPSGPRMAHIYVLNERRRDDVFSALQDMRSVEYVFYRESDGVYVSDGHEICRLEEYEFPDEYPRAKERVAGLMYNERCGDFVIAAKKGYEFERSEYKGAHGGLHFDESTGFAIVHSPRERESVREEGMITDVAPAVFSRLIG